MIISNKCLSDKTYRVKKRHALLLEVLIAFTLVVLTLIPLIYPHTSILVSQEKFIDKVELDHHVNELYTKMVEELYMNRVSWSDIMSERKVKIELPKNLPFEGTYQFSRKRQKPTNTEEAIKAVYLRNLDYEFVSLLDKKKSKFHYEVVVVRDLSVETDVPE